MEWLPQIRKNKTKQKQNPPLWNTQIHEWMCEIVGNGWVTWDKQEPRRWWGFLASWGPCASRYQGTWKKKKEKQLCTRKTLIILLPILHTAGYPTREKEKHQYTIPTFNCQTILGFTVNQGHIETDIKLWKIETRLWVPVWRLKTDCLSLFRQ